MSRSGTVLSSLARRPMAPTAAALIALLALVGCESGTQEPEAPTAEPVEIGVAPIPADEGSAAAPTPSASGGEIAPDRFPAELPPTASRAIPENFPNGLPVYPGSEPALGMSGSVDGSDRSALQLLSNDSPAEVARYYSEQLEATGWEITETKTTALGDTITATNGATTTVLFFRPSADGGTDILQLNEGGV